MAFVEVLTGWIQVGKALKKEIFDAIKSSLDDHETRLSAVEISSGTLEIFDETVFNGSRAGGLTGLLYYKAPFDLRITRVEIEIFEKGPITTGILSLDAKKSVDLDDANFATILTGAASINFATASDYDSDIASINTGLATINTGEYLKLDVTSLPATPLGKFRIKVLAEAV